MKKLLILILALVMCLTAFTGCEFLEGLLGGGEPEVEYHIDKAEAFLKNMYKNENSVTGADYEVVGQVRVAGVSYTVTWATDTDKVTVEALENGNYRINVNEKSDEEVAYKLIATITAGNGDTATVTFDRTVPVYNVLSWDEYMAAEKGDTVLVEGIVVAMNAKSLGNSRNHLFLADASGKGGYYVYQMDQDPVEAGVKVGMTVSVTGPVEPYSGMQEIKGGTFAIVDETIKTVNPVDITELVNAGTVNYAEYVGLAVTIKGVVLGAQDLEKDTSQYLYFDMADGTRSYVRTYVTDFPTTLDAKTATAENADKAAIDKLHADHFGYTADVTGILILYSGNPYLIPMSTDCFTNLTFVEKTAEEKVDAELDVLALETTVTSDTVVELAAVGKYYEDVTITWSSDNADLAAIADGKLTLTVPTTSTTVKVTATVVCGDVTKTKEFSIKLSMEATPIADIIAMGSAMEHNTYTADKYIVAGIITEVYNTTYGNMKITDAAGNILTIYGTYSADGEVRYDKLTAQPVAGDYVVILGIVGQYNGTPQVKNGWILSFTTPTTIPEANTIAGGLTDKGDPTEDKYLITGKVVEVVNTKYGNLYIEDEAGNKMYIYGLYDAAGNRYDAMVTNGNAPVVGDTITVLSVIGLYNSPQLKNATVVNHIVASTDTPTEHVCESVCATCKKCTDAACTESACADKCQGHEVSHPAGVVDPVVGTPYAFGMVQKNKENTTYYLKGGMNGYYLETTANLAEALHVYIEETTGGYYLYCMVDGAKTYINCVVSGTHVNGAYEATASTVYRYDATSKTLIAVVNDTDYWFGTRNDKTYTTVGPCAVSYAGFYCQFYNVDTTTPAPSHTHTACATCGLCTAEDCTGTANEKCAGHTTDPVVPPVAGNVVDLDTLTALDTTKTDTAYTDRKTASGWTATNARSDEQSGINTTSAQIILNGKTTAVGTLVSPTISGSISSLTLSYTNCFSENNGVSLTINVKVNGEVVATTQLVDTSVTKYAAETFTWTLDATVTGDFVIEIINNCPSASTSNKDRVSLWDISWN